MEIKTEEDYKQALRRIRQLRGEYIKRKDCMSMEVSKERGDIQREFYSLYASIGEYEYLNGIPPKQIKRLDACPKSSIVYQ